MTERKAERKNGKEERKRRNTQRKKRRSDGKERGRLLRKGGKTGEAIRS